MSHIHRILASMTHMHAAIQTMRSNLTQAADELIRKVDSCYMQKVGQQKDQAWIHRGTAAGALIFGVGVIAATGKGFQVLDGSSTVSIVTKVGEGSSSVNQSEITGTDSHLRKAETEQKKNSDIKQDITEANQRNMRTTESMQELAARLFRGMH